MCFLIFLPISTILFLFNCSAAVADVEDSELLNEDDEAALSAEEDNGEDSDVDVSALVTNKKKKSTATSTTASAKPAKPAKPQKAGARKPAAAKK